jgi:hypothetical protein
LLWIYEFKLIDQSMNWLLKLSSILLFVWCDNVGPWFELSCKYYVRLIIDFKSNIVYRNGLKWTIWRSYFFKKNLKGALPLWSPARGYRPLDPNQARFPRLAPPIQTPTSRHCSAPYMELIQLWQWIVRSFDPNIPYFLCLLHTKCI